MKLLNCTQAAMTVEIIDLPRRSWRVVPPSKLTVVLALAGIVATAILWATLG